MKTDRQGSDITLMGAGDHARVVLSLLRTLGIQPVAIVDDNTSLHGLKISGVTVTGPVTQESIAETCLIAIGNNAIRKQLAGKFSDLVYPSYVHPTAIIDETVTLGSGSVVMAGAIIQSGSKIGNHVIVNTGAVVDHDCTLSDYVHVAPNSTLVGGVRLHEGVFIGAGATVIEHREIGKWSKVGAGACVIYDIPAHCTAVGVPAKPITFHHD